MPKSLSAFIRDQLAAQQLSEKELAERSGLGLSHIYQILRGERKHTRSDTLDKIAAAFNMTPADMAIAMGRAQADLSADDAEALALWRQVASDRKDAAREVLRSFAVQPARISSNRRNDSATKRRDAHQRELERETRRHGENGVDPPLTGSSTRFSRLLDPFRAVSLPSASPA